MVERGRTGLIRDGHGDLRAEHVIVPAEDAIYIYDCIEFDPALRQIDVAADLAFLLMDLARLGAERPAFELVDAYRRAGLTREEFDGYRFVRLRQLRRLLDSGELNDELRRSSPAPSR